MQILAWMFFLALVALILAIDLGILNKEVKVVGARRAITFTLVLMALACLFSFPLHYFYEHRIWDFGQFTRHTPAGPVVERINGMDAVWQFLAAYLLELSLSADNVFVMAVIFKTFHIPRQFQHRVLLWGIIGALLMRGTMIGLGVVALRYLWWAMYAFGVLLILTGLKMLLVKDSEPHPEGNWLVRRVRKMFRVTNRIDGEHFFVKVPLEPASTPTANGQAQLVWAATPLFIALIVVEITDVLFAVDSIPAVFGVTHDPFIVFTSNIFAILGLRSLYFAVATLLAVLRYLKFSLGVLLTYIGVKMIVVQAFELHPPPLLALGPIVAILGVGVIASLLSGPLPKPPALQSEADIDLGGAAPDEASPPPATDAENSAAKPAT